MLGGWILSSDRDQLATPTKVGSDLVRFLPAGDPYLYPHAGLVLPTAPAEFTARHSLAGVPRRLLNSLVGRLLVGGEIVGSWGRAGGHVTIGLWRALSQDRRELVSTELEKLGRPLGCEVSVHWLDA